MFLSARLVIPLLAIVTSCACASGNGSTPATDMDVPRAAPDIQEATAAKTDLSVSDGQGATVPDADADVDGNTADTLVAAPMRIIAVGDLHGDLEAARRALKLAGVVDAAGHWTGATTIVVQTGDILDRWYLERELMDWLEALQSEAQDAGGDIIFLAGNHEDNNLEEYYPDVDPNACPAFADLPDDPSLAAASVTPACKKRAAALLPGGTYARKMGRWRVAVILGDSAFVHGGLRPEFVSSPQTIDDMNQRWAAFAKGLSGTEVDQDIYETMWDRSYSDDDLEPDCDALATVLAALGVSRMVVGHSRWPHINSACNGQVWRIDTGLSAYYGGNTEVLEITASGATPMVAPSP
jgi:hypothetical protein